MEPGQHGRMQPTTILDESHIPPLHSQALVHQELRLRELGGVGPPNLQWPLAALASAQYRHKHHNFHRYFSDACKFGTQNLSEFSRYGGTLFPKPILLEISAPEDAFIE
jgi:hypothetical protein